MGDQPKVDDWWWVRGRGIGGEEPRRLDEYTTYEPEGDEVHRQWIGGDYGCPEHVDDVEAIERIPTAAELAEMRAELERLRGQVERVRGVEADLREQASIVHHGGGFSLYTALDGASSAIRKALDTPNA